MMKKTLLILRQRFRGVLAAGARPGVNGRILPSMKSTACRCARRSPRASACRSTGVWKFHWVRNASDASVRHRGVDYDDAAWGQHARAGDVGAERLRRPRLCEYRLCLARVISGTIRPMCPMPRTMWVPTAHVRHPGIVGRPRTSSFRSVSATSNVYVWVQRTFRRLQRGQQAGRAVRHHEVS